MLSRSRLPPPLFFVSVASKRVSNTVSPLDATLAGGCVNVASKGLKAIVGSESVDGNRRSSRKMMTPYPPSMLDQYQNKRLMKFAFHKSQILKDMF